MNKKICLILAVCVLAAILCGCTYDVIDITYNFNRAIIQLPDGTIIDGKVDAWDDYKNSDQLQVKINGITYLTHAENVVLIKD